VEGLRPRVRIALILIFWLSGAAALAYQVLWTRQLNLIIGTSAIAVSTVLATFMAGLGLGAHLAGRIADRARNPLLLYGVAEVGIGVFALLTPALLSASGWLYLELYRAFQGTPGLAVASRAIAAAIVLIVPTTLMGATLPFVARFYIRRMDHLGRGLATLYGINTLGGVLGAGLVGYVLVFSHGVRASLHLAAAVNGLAAVAAIALSLLARESVLPKAGGADAPAAAPEAGVSVPGPEARLPRRWIALAMIGFWVSGFTTLAYEVLWARTLNFVIGNSVYAFTTILVVFLLGIFLGTLAAGQIADRARQRIWALGVVQLAAGLGSLVLFLLAPRLPALASVLAQRIGVETVLLGIAGKVVPAAIALLLPAVLLGLSFPLLLRVATDRLDRLGRRLGTAYAVNTVGAILGSLVAGFVLLPVVGLSRGMLLVVALNAAMSALFFWHAERRRTGRPLAVLAGLGALAVVTAAATITPRPFLVHTPIMTPFREILFHEEGRTATVVVTRSSADSPRQRGLEMYLNLLGMSVVDEAHFHQQHYATVALLPIVLHPRPERVFVVGLASGVTTGAAALDERVRSVTCVEISPEVVRAAAAFDSLSYGATSNPRIRNLVDDARAYLETTRERYDVIITDAFLSALTGTTALYSRDFFLLCRRRLAPGGVMSIGVGELKGIDRTVARAFVEAFPEVAVVLVPERNVYNRTYLIGGDEPLAISRRAVEGVYEQPAMAAELARFHFGTPEVLLGSYLISGEVLARYLTDVPPCTDDRPIIDFQAVAGAEGFGIVRQAGGRGIRSLIQEAGRPGAFPAVGP